MKNITLTIKDWRWIRALRNEMGLKHNSRVISFLKYVYDSFPDKQQTDLQEGYLNEDKWDGEIEI